MGDFGKPIHKREEGGVAIRGGKSHDKVQGDVGRSWYSAGMEERSRAPSETPGRHPGAEGTPAHDGTSRPVDEGIVSLEPGES